MIVFSNLFLNQDVYFGMNCQKTNWTQKGFSYIVCSCKKENYCNIRIVLK